MSLDFDAAKISMQRLQEKERHERIEAMFKQLIVEFDKLKQEVASLKGKNKKVEAE
jgi:hypothetical protein